MPGDKPPHRFCWPAAILNAVNTLLDAHYTQLLYSTASFTASLAGVRARKERQQTGKGQHIDLSQVEAVTQLYVSADNGLCYEQEEIIGRKPQGWEYSEDAGEDDKKHTGSDLGTSMITSEYQRLDHNE